MSKSTGTAFDANCVSHATVFSFRNAMKSFVNVWADWANDLALK